MQTYYTQLVGDPTSMPTIKASADMAGNGLAVVIESDPWTSDGPSYVPTNIFFRQIRNLIIDTTSVPGTTWAIHWPSAQATSIQNVIFHLPQTPDSDHTGIYMEEGSGGFLGDLVFYGGQWGARFGNQQYTTRNLTFVNCQTAILHIWDWFWVYKDITVVDCGVGINMTGPVVGSAVIIDSVFYNVSIGILSSRSVGSAGDIPGRGTLIMENVIFQNVESIFQGSNGSLLEAQDAPGTLINGMILVGIPFNVCEFLTDERGTREMCTHPVDLLLCSQGPTTGSLLLPSSRKATDTIRGPSRSTKTSPPACLSPPMRLVLKEMETQMTPPPSRTFLLTSLSISVRALLVSSMQDTTKSPTLSISLQTLDLWARL